jgi:hypothetical protein
MAIDRTSRSFISTLADYLVATSEHAHGPIGDSRTAARRLCFLDRGLDEFIPEEI